MTNRSDPFEINKGTPTFMRTRKENTKAGAKTGAAIYGGVGAGLGAAASTSNARRGLKALKEVGAYPSNGVARRLVAGHATKGALATGAVAGLAGAGIGAGVGALESPKGSKLGEAQREAAIAHQKRKAAKANAKAVQFSKSAFGIEHLEKADRRMGGQAAWSGHLPKHTPGAVAANKSAFLSGIEMPGNVRPVKPGLRVTRKLVKIPK